MQLLEVKKRRAFNESNSTVKARASAGVGVHASVRSRLAWSNLHRVLGYMVRIWRVQIHSGVLNGTPCGPERQ